MLEFPDDIGFPATPTHSAATQTFLVTNVGERRAAFALEAAPPFAVRPALGELSPGEVLRCCIEYRPATAGALPLPSAACMTFTNGAILDEKAVSPDEIALAQTASFDSSTLIAAGKTAIVLEQGCMSPCFDVLSAWYQQKAAKGLMRGLPWDAGQHRGDVRIAYASGDVAHARLQGAGMEVDAGLAVRTLQLPPTFMRQRSMASFR